MTAARPPVLAVQGLSKSFPGTRALQHLDLRVEHGSVHALLGHNGSGKSTFIKVLAGVHAPDPGGRVLLRGEEFSCESAEGQHRGVRFVHQDLGIIDELTAMENMAMTLGYSRTRTGRIDWVAQERSTRTLLDQFEIDLDVRRPLSESTAVQRTAVAIARAMAGFDPTEGLLVLDEPTAALPSNEVDHLFDLITRVRAAGTGVIYVSHRLDEVGRIADAMTVLRDGHVVLSGAVAEHSPHEIANAIAGREVNVLRSVQPASEGARVVLAVDGLEGPTVHDFDVKLRQGEIVGVAGLVGSGRDDLPYLIAGASPAVTAGRWDVGGRRIHDPSQNNLRDAGLILLPADRARESVVATMTVRENLTLSSLDTLRTKGGSLSLRREAEFAARWLSIVGASAEVADRDIATLSGGNQQKVVLARSLATDPAVLVMAEPTAGVDVGARQALYDELRRFARDGLAVLICSSDLEDLTGVCERVIVMRAGRAVAELDGALVTSAGILAAMEGIDVPAA